MISLTEFSNTDWHVRSAVIDGDPVFVAKDVCAAVKISKYRDAVANLDEDERVSMKVDTLGGRQEMLAVTESGLYALIFQSRKPQARAFRLWVTGEVLPQLRRTGIYQTMPPVGLQRLETEIAQARAEIARKADLVARKADLVARARRIEGQVSIRVFLLAAGIELAPRNRIGGLAARCHGECRYQHLPTGRIQQRRAAYDGRDYEHGWIEVSTFPPEVIVSQLLVMGIKVPSLSPEKLRATQAAYARPLLSAEPLALPEPAAPESRFPSFDFGHGAEVHT